MKRQSSAAWAALAMVTAPGVVLAQDVKRGEKLFEECRACHAIEPNVNNVGPSLAAVLGRKAGTLDDFRYSPAMKRSNVQWNLQTLDAFIAEPQAVVPANRMPYSGLPDAKDRADLIAYITQGLRPK